MERANAEKLTSCTMMKMVKMVVEMSVANAFTGRAALPSWS
jgi:hypothetical protein